jgi:hypothetical protein
MEMAANGSVAANIKRLLFAWVPPLRSPANGSLSCRKGNEKARLNSNIKLPFAGLVGIVTNGYADSVRFTIMINK